MFRFLKIVSISFLIFISFLALLTVDAVGENLLVDSQLREFISKGVFVEQVDEYCFYEVEIEEELRTPSIEFSSRKIPLSVTPGDIYIYKESEIDVLPFAKEFISYFFGGHAGIVYDDTKTIDAFGASFNPEDNIIDFSSNNVLSSYRQRDVIGLRVNATDEEVEKAVDFSYDAVGKSYNLSFVFNRKNSFYCTDLISRAYSKENGLNFNLDQDGIATSCNDLVLSDDTYLIYYMFENNGLNHLYYAVNK